MMPMASPIILKSKNRIGVITIKPINTLPMLCSLFLRTLDSIALMLEKGSSLPDLLMMKPLSVSFTFPRP